MDKRIGRKTDFYCTALLIPNLFKDPFSHVQVTCSRTMDYVKNKLVRIWKEVGRGLVLCCCIPYPEIPSLGCPRKDADGTVPLAERPGGESEIPVEE
jgi:hypothetical protein